MNLISSAPLDLSYDRWSYRPRLFTLHSGFGVINAGDRALMRVRIQSIDCGVPKSALSGSYYCWWAKMLSTTETEELLRLCKTGRLSEVQDWIASGKSICVPADSRTTPL